MKLNMHRRSLLYVVTFVNSCVLADQLGKKNLNSKSDIECCRLRSYCNANIPIIESSQLAQAIL